MKYDILVQNNKKLTSNKITLRFIVGFLVFLLMFVLLMAKTAKKIETIVTHTHEHMKTIEIAEMDTFTVPKLIKYMQDLNLKHCDIVFAQAIEETGHFTSGIYKENNNLFGMKCAKQRPYAYTGKNRGHAYYDNWRQSVQDYAMWQAAYANKLRDRDKYFTYLSNYAEKPGYANRLKVIIEKNEALWN